MFCTQLQGSRPRHGTTAFQRSQSVVAPFGFFKPQSAPEPDQGGSEDSFGLTTSDTATASESCTADEFGEGETDADEQSRPLASVGRGCVDALALSLITFSVLIIRIGDKKT